MLIQFGPPQPSPYAATRDLSALAAVALDSTDPAVVAALDAAARAHCRPDAIPEVVAIARRLAAIALVADGTIAITDGRATLPLTSEERASDPEDEIADLTREGMASTPTGAVVLTRPANAQRWALYQAARADVLMRNPRLAARAALARG